MPKVKVSPEGRLIKGLLAAAPGSESAVTLPRFGQIGVAQEPKSGFCRLCGAESTVARVKRGDGYELEVVAGCEHVSDAWDDFWNKCAPPFDGDYDGAADAVLAEFEAQMPESEKLPGQGESDEPAKPTPEIVVHERAAIASTSRSKKFWTPIDLADTVEMQYLVEPLLYQGCHHVVSGEKGKGKSLFFLRVAYELGPRAAWFDQENYARATFPRLVSFGAKPGDEKQLPLYRDNGAFTYEMFESEVLPALLKADVEVLFLDPMRLFYRRAGVNDAGAYGGVDEYALRVIQKLNAHGIATVALDNTGVNGGNRAKGDGAKGDNVELEWSLSAPTAVTIEKPGLIKLTCVKDRHGRVGENTELRYRVGGSPFIFEPVDRDKAPAKPISDNPELDARILRDAYEVLADGPLSKNKLLGCIHGDTNRKTAVLNRAEADGELVKTKKGTAFIWSLPTNDEQEAAA